MVQRVVSLDGDGPPCADCITLNSCTRIREAFVYTLSLKTKSLKVTIIIQVVAFSSWFSYQITFAQTVLTVMAYAQMDEEVNVTLCVFLEFVLL